MIFICLQIDIRPEKREEFLPGMEQYVADVNAEPGCLGFECGPSLRDPNRFLVVETFKDSDAGAAHVGTAHAKAFFEWLPSFVTKKPDIIYQELDGWNEMAEVAPRED